MMPISCHRFRTNEVRLWLSVIAYNLATAGAAEEDRELFADEPAAAAGENGRATDQARQVLLVDVGPGTSAPAPVWPDAAPDLGTAAPERVAHRLRLQSLGAH